MGFAFVPVLIWIFIVVAMIASMGKRNKTVTKNSQEVYARLREMNRTLQDRQSDSPASEAAALRPEKRPAPEKRMAEELARESFTAQHRASSAPRKSVGAGSEIVREERAAYGGRMRADSGTFGRGKDVNISQNSVLFEDRRNDWLARQLREEAAVLRRSNGFDLGASHSSSCDAREIKSQHARRHNTNGIDRGSF